MPSDKLRTVIGAAVVLAGLGALAGAVAMVLNAYPSAPATKGVPATDLSGSVVAVLTPIVAAIVAVVGLYFGVSATGSARGQEARAGGGLAQSGEKLAQAAERIEQKLPDQ